MSAPNSQMPHYGSDPSKTKVIRCAIYCRKSSDENLDNDFNSLDAQREYCEAYVKSQAALGWVVIAERYDDAGYSGGTTNRPAFNRLMDDVRAGKVDVIVVYKYERFSPQSQGLSQSHGALGERECGLRIGDAAVQYIHQRRAHVAAHNALAGAVRARERLGANQGQDCGCSTQG